MQQMSCLAQWKKAIYRIESQNLRKHMSNLKTRIDRLEEKMKPERKGGLAVNFIDTKDELTEEEIKELKSKNFQILTFRFID
jgi:hypothetical protein